MDDPRIDELLADLTLEEKVSLTAGKDMWHVPGVPRLGIPSLKVTDGPNGARGDGLAGTGLSCVCIPCGSALAATWNPALIERVGAMLGDEARTKAAHVLLAPTVNLHRSPLGGRNFECYSEDPYLTSRIAVAFIRGVQSRGVGTTIKHFAGNESEFERMTIDSTIGERALRELYLPPFEAAVREADAWGVMAAYNRLNGAFCTESEDLLTRLLKEEWGFRGLVVSDWLATHSTVPAARAGLDLEMPGPPAHFGARLVDAVRAGEIREAQVDDKVRRILRMAVWTRAFEDPMDHAEEAVDLPEHRALAREAALDGAVLLKNDGGALPLDASKLRRVAVVGPNAGVAQIMGGGSANVRAHYLRSPLAALRDRLGSSVEVVHEPGCQIHRHLPRLQRGLATPDGEPGIAIEYFAGQEHAGPVIHRERREHGALRWFGRFSDAVDPRSFSCRAVTRFTPEQSGEHRFGMLLLGEARLYLDGELAIDASSRRLPRGESFFGYGTDEIVVTADLVAGRPCEIVLEYANRGARDLGGALLGAMAPTPTDLMERAIAAARDADAAIVVVGTSEEWETEGRDRESIDLPLRQAELIERVAAVQPRTVVVVNAGSPIAMPWLDHVPAVLDVWLGGQEMADALAALLVGDANPSGKLPTTFPVRLEDTPAFLDYPGEAGRVVYGEGVFGGYRFYDTRDVTPLFPFGHGLSYTTFAYGEPRLSSPRVAPGETLVVEVDVENTGTRAGSEVVQLYVRPRTPRLARPFQELKAFAKLTLGPGATATARLTLDDRAFAAWDPKPHRWTIDPGPFELHIGSSSRDIRQTIEVERTP